MDNKEEIKKIIELCEAILFMERAHRKGSYIHNTALEIKGAMEQKLSTPSSKEEPTNLCQKCWDQAFSETIDTTDKTQTERYIELLKENNCHVKQEPKTAEAKDLAITIVQTLMNASGAEFEDENLAIDIIALNLEEYKNQSTT